VSISTGHLTVSAREAVYRLNMPAYELQHVGNARTALPEAIAIEGARRAGSSCSADSTSMTCTMRWEFDRAPESVTVTSKLAAITVPNHVHILTAVRGGLSDRAVLDENTPSATLRFGEPGALDRLFTARPMSALAILLACFTAGIAARSRRELLLTVAAFASGIGAGFVFPWLFATRFVEAAVAVSCAYIAFEALALPASDWWALLPALPGLALGLYLRVLTETGAVWLAAAAVSLSILLGFAGLASRRVVPAAVLAISAIWLVATLAL
jgi:hypothetical protein